MEGFQGIARQFINTTKSHLFLTGKAGTGKTTFLKNLSSFTHKSFIVVAPTGIASLNAGGVTVHSQFLLPFGTFIPDNVLPHTVSDSRPFYNQNTLAQKHPLNSLRKQVLRSVDLIVIDEVSMLRADLLDAIDYRLKAARGNYQESFGGVQMLFIGDLYQLPPVVKREEESLLSAYYKTPWFYEAKALANDPLVFIELDKVYRQNDADFINLLNNLRNNVVTQADIDTLNAHYQTPEAIASLQEVITLTTHNYKADELNSKALQALTAPSYYFKGTIEGDFPDSMNPVLHQLELKVGAQIMFVRNDAEGQYFNGKLAIITEITENDVWVEMAVTHTRYKLKREKWENKKYTLQDQNRELNEEVVGSFEQFPIKLAWAITVHKSQGLTFEKAIIDVGEAFADGQVYVALSRLRSLDGLVLRTRIQAKAISTDKNIAHFTHTNHQPNALQDVMKVRQQEFIRHLLDKAFDLSIVIREFNYVLRDLTNLTKENSSHTLNQIVTALEAEKLNTEKFRKILKDLLAEDSIKMMDRLKSGSAYYYTLLNDKLKMLLQHLEETRREKRVKTYLTQLAELDIVLTKKIKEIEKAPLLTQGILNNEEFNNTGSVSNYSAARERMLQEIQDSLPILSAKKIKKPKKKKAADDKSTYDITLDLLKTGMTVTEIADHRCLVPATIEGHLARAVAAQTVSITSFVHEKSLKEILDVINTLPEDFELPTLYQHFKGVYSYGLLRAVVSHKALDVK